MNGDGHVGSREGVLSLLNVFSDSIGICNGVFSSIAGSLVRKGEFGNKHVSVTAYEQTCSLVSLL